MRIFSRKSFQFDHPTGSATAEIIQAGTFGDVPDWVADSSMFKLASKDGDIEVIGSRQDEIAAETGSKKKAKTDAKVKADGDLGTNPADDPAASVDAATDGTQQ